MRQFDALNFVRRVRGVPLKRKRDFIRQCIVDKDVLDLGFIAHTLDSCLNHPEKWLHNIIRDNARSVVGVDILEEEVRKLKSMGYEAICGDALSLRLKGKFDVVVCGDLLEHVANPGALLETISYHLRDDGMAVLTTPNPLAISRFFNIMFDGWTHINKEHVSWFCPQTIFQLVERSNLFVDDFYWIETDFPMKTVRKFWGRLANFLSARIARLNHLLQNDYAVVLRKKPELLKDSEQHPFVSVILPTCNRPDFLSAAFETLLQQDYRRDRFEIIVVDNGAGNAGKVIGKILHEYDNEVTVKYVHEQRPGLVYARHSGAWHSKGAILLFGDDDGIFDPNWISALVDVYLKYPDIGAVGSKIAILWDREPLAWVKKYEQVMGKLYLGENIVIQYGLYINGGSFSVKRELLEAVGGFNPGQLGEYILGDSESGLCRKLALLNVPVAWTPKTTMWHLQSAAINGTLTDLKRRYRNNGICSAYFATYYGWSVWQVCQDIVAKTREFIGSAFHCLRSLMGESACRQLILKAVYYCQYVKFMFLYRTNPRIRSEIDMGKWRYDCGYVAPPVVVLRQNRLSLMGEETV